MKAVRLKIFGQDNKQFKTCYIHPPDGKQFSDYGRMKAMSDVVNGLQEKFPQTVFRVVKTGKDQFNVLHV